MPERAQVLAHALGQSHARYVRANTFVLAKRLLLWSLAICNSTTRAAMTAQVASRRNTLPALECRDE